MELSPLLINVPLLLTLLINVPLLLTLLINVPLLKFYVEVMVLQTKLNSFLTDQSK